MYFNILNKKLQGATRFTAVFASLVALFFAILSGCSTKVELNAPYKETAVIYCLLNGDSTVQYARVSKGFQNREGNAFTIAKYNRDSSEYPAADNISVELIKMVDTTQTVLGSFLPTEDNNKDTTGDFYAPAQTLYVYKGPKLADGTYKIRLTNKRTGYVTQAGCPLVGGFKLDPSMLHRANPPAYPDAGYYLGFYNTGYSSQVKVTAAAQAVVYKLDVVTNYTEYYKDGHTAQRSFSWRGAGSFSADGQSAYAAPSATTFFDLLLARTVPDPNVAFRKFDPFDVYVWAGGAALDQYANNAGAYSILLGETPIYTNFDRGLGLFSSRRMLHFNAYAETAMVIDMNDKDASQNYKYPKIGALNFRVN